MSKVALLPRVAFAFYYPAVCLCLLPSSMLAAEASLRILADKPSPYRVPTLINGKFTEHLFNNVYYGIDSQVLRNPTFASYPFWTGQATPDGVATFHWEREKIDSQIQREAVRLGWPEAALTGLKEAYGDGLACRWNCRPIRCDGDASQENLAANAELNSECRARERSEP